MALHPEDSPYHHPSSLALSQQLMEGGWYLPFFLMPLTRPINVPGGFPRGLELLGKNTLCCLPSFPLLLSFWCVFDRHPPSNTMSFNSSLYLCP